MTELAIKDVEFNGATLRAAQDTENIIWVGVAWVCQGLGLSEGQMKNERKKIQTDEVLVQGTKFHPLGSGNSDSEVLCLKLNFLPLWLAKIHVTPKMRRDNPTLAGNLTDYQLKAKDVLADAFLNKNAVTPVGNYSKQIEDLQDTITEMRQENQKMYKDMSALANVILDWKESFEKNTPIKPAIPESNAYISWKKAMYKKMDHICENTTKFEKRNDVMKWMYRSLNKKYGVVWEQEEREYKEKANENIINIAKESEKNKKVKNKIIIILTIVIILSMLLLITNIIYRNFEITLEYDNRLIKCETKNEDIICSFNGISLVTLYSEYINIDNETLIFVNGKMLLQNKIKSHYESWDSMAELNNGNNSSFNTEIIINKSKDIEDCKGKIKVFYTKTNVNKIKNISKEKLQKVIEESDLMLEI